MRKSPHIKKGLVSPFVCWRFLNNSSVSIFMLIPGTPCRPPGPDWLHLGSMCVPLWSNFPVFSAVCAELLQRLRKKLRKKLAENLQRTSKKLTRNAKNFQRTSKKLMQRTFPNLKSQAAYSIIRRDSNRKKPPAIKKKGAAVLALAHSDLEMHP